MSPLDLLPPRPEGSRCPRIAEIKRVVAEHFDISIAGLDGPCRDRRLARPRQVVMWLSRKVTHQSTTVIARNLGGRDHSTIVVGAQRIDKLLQTDPALWDDVNAVISELHLEGAE